MLANGKGTDGLHTIIVQIPVAIATVIAKTMQREFLSTHCLQIALTESRLLSRQFSDGFLSAFSHQKKISHHGKSLSME